MARCMAWLQIVQGAAPRGGAGADAHTHARTDHVAPPPYHTIKADKFPRATLHTKRFNSTSVKNTQSKTPLRPREAAHFRDYETNVAVNTTRR